MILPTKMACQTPLHFVSITSLVLLKEKRMRVFRFKDQHFSLFKNIIKTISVCFRCLQTAKQSFFSLPTSERRGCAGGDRCEMRSRTGLFLFPPFSPVPRGRASHTSRIPGWERKKGLLCSVRCLLLAFFTPSIIVALSCFCTKMLKWNKPFVASLGWKMSK